MATTTGTMNIFYSAGEFMTDGTIDLDGDTFSCLLTTSAFAPLVGTHTVLTDVSNEVTGNGYARVVLTTVTWNRASNIITFDCDPIIYNASGGSIVARNFIIFDDTVTTPVVDPLLVWGLLDNAVADVTTPDGNPLTITPNASGLFRLTV